VHPIGAASAALSDLLALGARSLDPVDACQSSVAGVPPRTRGSICGNRCEGTRIAVDTSSAGTDLEQDSGFRIGREAKNILSNRAGTHAGDEPCLLSEVRRAA